jgi:chromosome segregation ATPase
MKNQTILLTLLSAALVVGCDKPRSTSQQMDDVQERTAAATQDLKERDYTFAQKAEYTAQMETRLATINQELDRLEARIEKSSAAAQAEARPKLVALREQAARLKSQLNDVENATESTWDSVKANSIKAYDALADGFQQAGQWVNEKLAR